MLDGFIIEKIKEEENRRREDRRPQLQIPVFVDDEYESDLLRQEHPVEGDKKETTSKIEY